MNKCILMRGYAGSGKSFKAKQLAEEFGNCVICSADTYWIDSKGNYNFDVSKLKLAHEYCYNEFKKAVTAGKNVIVDNTNLKFEDCKKYFDYILKNNNVGTYRYAIDICEVSFNDLDTAISLRTNREDGKNIPKDKMRSMFDLFKKLNCISLMTSNYIGKIDFVFERDVVEYNWLENSTQPEKKNCVICDLDGTLAIFKLADGTMLRNAFDASLCESDLINSSVAKTISALELVGNEIIFVSGREDKFRVQTEAFLKRVSEKYGMNVGNKLYMRKSGDFRSDDIVKNEIYSNHIKDKYNVVCVFDDRPKVVKLWRALGLFVFDCNYRGEEF